MPSASDEQVKLMQKWFGPFVCDNEPYCFLLARGWYERAGVWQKPTPSHNPSVYEVECLIYLRDEWDFDWAKPLYPTLNEGFTT